jgi:hypothetical protein
MRIDRSPTAADLLAYGLTERLKVHFRLREMAGAYAVVVRVGRTAADMAAWEMVFPAGVPHGVAIDELGGRVCQILIDRAAASNPPAWEPESAMSEDDRAERVIFPRFKQPANL